ncbi:MAG: hypothetical protein EZS28_031193, partial [Streblomastix strix]
MPDSKNVEIDRHKRIAEGKRLLFSFYGIPELNQRKFLKEYPGFNWNDANKVAEKYNININCYEYVGEGFEDDIQKPKYQRLISYPDMQVEGRKPYNILLLNDDIGNQHIMYIINVEKLIGLLICPICNNHAIYAKDENRHVQRKMDAHIKECTMKLGNPNKQVRLEKFSKPFAPHITSNQTYKYLLSHNRLYEYKPTQYYITFLFNTVFQQEDDIKYPVIKPISVASAIKTKSGIKTCYFDCNEANFIDQWLDYLFAEAKQVKIDNKYLDEVPQRYEVPVIGFDSLKTSITLIFRNLQSKNYEIVDFVGQTSSPKYFIVKPTEKYLEIMKKQEPTRVGAAYADQNVNSIRLKFLDAKNYLVDNISFEKFIEDLGQVKFQENDSLQADNEITIVSQSKLMINSIDFLINLYIKNKIDLLANTSLAKLACLDKYSHVYKNFDIDTDYTPQTDDASFDLTEKQWKYKVESYKEQDKLKKRRTDHNVSDTDYKYFHDLFISSCCHMCKTRFTYKNQPTLDRIDNEKSHTKTNVKPCCLYCNKYASNKDKETARLMIQLRKFAQLNHLAMTISDQEVYKILRNNMIGGNSYVMHRENISGLTPINKFKYNCSDKTVHSIDLPHIISHITCLDFNSFYPSVMSSNSHILIPYTNHKMYMPGDVTSVIKDEYRARQIIYNENRFSCDEDIIENKVQLFIAVVKAHIPEEFINEFIDFPVIWRNLKITMNKQTLGEYTYKNMIEHHMACDKEESKLLMLSSTHNEFMTFNNYYLWFLIDRCHLVIDEIQQVITYSKNTSFHEFVNETHKLRCDALVAGNKNLELMYKIKLNASFGYDALNTEKFQDIRICNRQKLGMCHMLNTFMSERYLSDNLSVVELEKRKCQCSTPLQVAYFVMDNSKYFYLNTFYNFLVPCLDMNKIHVIYGDTDSLCLGIADNNWPIKNQKLWNKLYPQFFPMSDQIDEKKKLLGWNIEHQVKTCFALAPKCYYLDTYDNGEIMKLKG